MDGYSAKVEHQMTRLYQSLAERDRRRYAAVEVEKLGHGGLEYIAQLFGCDPKTIRRGMAELESEEELASERQRKKGGEGKSLNRNRIRKLVENFKKVLSDHTAGDPMREDVKWTNLSRRQISRRLKDLGTPAGKNVVSRLLWEHGYRRRKPQKKRNDGTTCRSQRTVRKDRRTERTVSQRQASSDQHRHEKEGDARGFLSRRGGPTRSNRPSSTITISPVPAMEKSFRTASMTWQRTKRRYISTAVCDTSELACDSIELWFREQGHSDYPDATDLLVLCDGGGSNSSSHYIFKEDLQALSNRLGLKIRICHYPPYCSKYNPIEHRVFPHVTRACKGVPLETIETAKHYIEKNRNDQGAQGSCPNARQGVSDRTQIRQGLQAKT